MSLQRYTKNAEKNFILALTALFLFLTFLVIADILQVLILSIILAYFLYPLYIGFLARFSSKSASSILTLTCATLGFFLPLMFLFYFIILRMGLLVLDYREYVENPELLNEFLVTALFQITNSKIFESFDISGLVISLVQFIGNWVQGLIESIPLILLNFFIILFVTYYLLIYSKEIFESLNDYLPLTRRKQDEIFRNISKNIQVLFRGYFLTGLIQTAVAAIGYIVLDLIYGFPNLLIIIFLTLIVSLVPYLGTPMIWVPMSIYYFIIDLPEAGTLLFIYGLTVISLIDNFIRPILMSHKETTPPPLVFVGFVGGIFAFGIIGLIIGPIIISISMVLLKFIREEYTVLDESK
ncbi:MAG: AI-2E family transporter [Candidatus Woesearchaeota archaeon]